MPTFARATHGETINEVLGSGDGTKGHHRFTLNKPPLTHVSATTASGAQSTLKIRVNGILWEETDRLFRLDERSENYIVRIEEDGKTQTIFGDAREARAYLPERRTSLRLIAAVSVSREWSALTS